MTVAASTDGGAHYTEGLPLPQFLAQDTAALWQSLPTDHRLQLRFTLHGTDTLSWLKFSFINEGD